MDQVLVYITSPNLRVKQWKRVEEKTILSTSHKVMYRRLVNLFASADTSDTFHLTAPNRKTSASSRDEISVKF